ncbi:hypothetical protein GCK32_007442 [Trichostrongylus colubriformis]|uniref:F-box domain-containing protein n=1 Tax=Trichostrongylus colubriformis TaxID=6319 RepID=A0AAN8FQD9_TRICO
MPVGLIDLPLELLVTITNNLSVKSCNSLAKVSPQLRAAVNLSLKNMTCHVQGYWREQDPKFEVIFERNGDEVVLARNIEELNDVLREIKSFKKISIALDVGDFSNERLSTRNRPLKFSLDFLREVQHVETVEWDCDIDVKLEDIPDACSQIVFTNHNSNTDLYNEDF